jgi:phospholipase/carboxylesterase/glyoxalase family protein
MLMLHGRNAGPANILELVPLLDRPTLTYLAPAAANNTWYPFGFMAKTASNEPWLTSALSVLHRVLSDAARHGIGPERTLLLGFSQGACLAAEYAVRYPSRYGGIVVLSGGLIGPQGTTWDEQGSFERTPVFLGCGDPDPHIPRQRVDESARVFTRMGADVVERIYPGMGHLVSDEEIAMTRDMIDRVRSKG